MVAVSLDFFYFRGRVGTQVGAKTLGKKKPEQVGLVVAFVLKSQATKTLAISIILF
jgi:hypothetical protein